MSQLRNTLQFAKKLSELGILKGGNVGYTKTLLPLSKYYKFGLLSDDLMKESNDVIAEAVRRLPKEVFDERQFRLSRAIQYNSGKTILPESEWTKPEQDVRYLKPFIDQVLAEAQEKDDWNSGKIE